MILKRIDPLSLAKVLGIGYTALGFLLGLFFAAVSLISPSSGTTGGTGFAKVLGVGAVVAMPLFYGVIGVVTGFLSAWIYNLIASFIGGIKLEFEQ